MQKCLKLLLIGFFTLSQTLLNARLVMAQYDADVQFAQGGLSVDVEPPLIEHDILEQAEADIRQTFVASVVDDQELDSVLLYYRFTGETSYSRYSMTRVSFSSSYVAQIPTDPNDLIPIEYYIQARDTSGNRTVRGYTFSPLVRQIVPVLSDSQNASTNQLPPSGLGATNGGQTIEKTGPRINKTVYVVAGVLLLGIIASAASSSSGGSSSPLQSGDCGASGCLLTLTVNRPTP